jgi:hypothetical protein
MYYRLSIVAVWVAVWVTVYLYFPTFHPHKYDPYLIHARSGQMVMWAFYLATMAAGAVLIATMTARENYVERREEREREAARARISMNAPATVTLWDECRGQCEGASVTRDW